MPTSLITLMRLSHLFMRGTAGVVLMSFSLMVLQPAIAAAQSANTPTTVAPDDSAEAQLSQTLVQIEEKLAKLEDKLQNGQDAAAERGEIKQFRQSLSALDEAVRTNFAKVEQHIHDHALPQVILERHQAMVASYAQELQALTRELEGIDSASDDVGRLNHAKTAKSQLMAKQNKRRQQPFDPSQLPNETLKADPSNKPKESAEQFTKAGLSDTPLIQLAALGDFTFDKLAGASNPAYLAETDEITLTQAIKDKALELNYDPVKIHHWVRNHIEWQPTWGGIQNAGLTLSARRGNAMDIASLTIALLRASKIPARYAHGTIDIPAAAFKNWAGGFTDINAAIDFAASGGIPVVAVTSDGQITKVRIEHIWVEAAIDYQSSRGAKNRDADSWVALDPSYKQYDYKKGLDAVAISGIDPGQLAQSFIASGTVNESESWVTGFNAQILKDAQTEAQQKLQSYIENNLTDPTVGDVIGGRKAIVQEFPILPSGLPNKLLLTGARYDKLPTNLQQRIRYSFGKDIEGYMIDPVDFPFAKVNNEKLTLSFKPATDADEQTLKSLLPEGEVTDLSQLPTTISSYLIQVVPELKLNGQTIKTGSPMRLGEDLPLITDAQFAGRGSLQSPRTYYVIAGSYLAVNAYAGSVSPQILTDTKAQLEHTKAVLESADSAQIAALSREDLLGDLFHAGGLGYYAQLTVLSHILGLQAGAHHTLAAGTGTFGYEPKVNYFFGFPRSIAPGGVVFDIPLVGITASNDGNLDKKKQFTLQTGILSSALEHVVPEQMFVNEQNPGEAISAVKALQKANAQGQRIYHITAANQSAILGNIQHNVETMNEIRNALNAGKEVITHTDAVSVPGWTGAGYIILDKDTEAGAFKIAGGGNGGFASLFSILLEVLVLFHVEYDTGSLVVSKVVERLARAALVLSFVAILIELIDECGFVLAVVAASFLGVISYFGSGILLGIAFANTTTVINGIFIITLGNFLLDLINKTFTDLVSTLCNRKSATAN